MKQSLVILLIILAGCSSSTSTTTPNPDVGVQLRFVNKKGQNLLDPERNNTWNEDNLDIYFLTDEGKTKVFDGNLDHPKHFKIFKKEDNYVMLLWLSHHIIDGYTTTYIDFPNSTEDTLRLKAKRADNGVTIGEKLWYDGDMVWESGHQQPLEFVISKSEK